MLSKQHIQPKFVQRLADNCNTCKNLCLTQLRALIFYKKDRWSHLCVYEVTLHWTKYVYERKRFFVLFFQVSDESKVLWECPGVIWGTSWYIEHNIWSDFPSEIGLRIWVKTEIKRLIDICTTRNYKKMITWMNSEFLGRVTE